MTAASPEARSDRLGRLWFEMTGFPRRVAPQGVGRVAGLVRQLPSPWDGLLLIATCLGLFAGATFGARVIVAWPDSPFTLSVGLPLLVVCGATAAHLVPPRAHELVD